MRFTIVIILLLLSAITSAQVFGADLSLRVEVQPPMPVPPGTNITVKFTAKNNSAFPVFAGIGQFRDAIPPNVPPFDTAGIESNATCASCDNFTTVCFETGLIAPGSEVQCAYTRPAQTYTGNPQRLRWLVFSFPIGTSDPNFDDNIVQFEYRFLPPTPVQVVISPLSYGLMGLLMLGLGGFVVRRS